MASVYVSSDIKKIFLAAFREIFAGDPDFTYNKTDPKQGKILITTNYTTPDAEVKVPQIIFPTIGYSTLTTSLGNNFYQELSGDLTVPKNSLREYSNIISFAMGIDSISTLKAEAERVADIVFNAVTMNYAQLFLELNMNIRGASVSEAVPRAQYPQTNFTSTISIQGDFAIKWTMGPRTNSPMLADIKQALSLDINP